jgi:hypothetical protein
LVDVGIGDAVDPAKTMKLAVGDTGTITAKKHHFAIARVATESSIRSATDKPHSQSSTEALCKHN